MPYSFYSIEAFLENGSRPLTKHHYANEAMHRWVLKAIINGPKFRSEIEG